MTVWCVAWTITHTPHLSLWWMCRGRKREPSAEAAGITGWLKNSAGRKCPVLVWHRAGAGASCFGGAKVEIPVEDGIDCYLITIGEKAKTAGAKWLKALREAGIAADQDYLGRKMKAQFKAADRSNARFAVILGEDEMEQGRINVKHLDSGEQETIELEQLIPYIKANIRRR